MNIEVNDMLLTEREWLILNACLSLPGEFPSCRKICDSCRGSKSLAHLDFWPGEERGILEGHGYDISLMAPLCPNFYKASKHLLASKPLSQPKLTSEEMANVLAANEDRKVTKAILIRYCAKLGLTNARKG
jgi:hypothetical protein